MHKILGKCSTNGGRQLDDSASISFIVNGKDVQVVPSQVPATLSLATYLREHLMLTGTKVMCNQAGCGVCVVTAAVPDGVGKSKTISVNSCVTPVLSCQGWNITTVEGIGDLKTGFNPIQSRLAGYHGTQCGYCSAGMVMQMNAHLEVTCDAKVDDIEDILDGNICRCTAYRPILDSFKSFAKDCPDELKEKLGELSKEAQVNFAPQRKVCCKVKTGNKGFYKTEDGSSWWVPKDVDELLNIIKGLPSGANYRMVAGNTGVGVYAKDGPYTDFIDVRSLPELSAVSTGDSLTMGANVTLHRVIEVMEELAKDDPANYTYGTDVVIHFKKVAHTAVRYTGTVAGNLLMKHAHQEFQSDVFITLEAVGATLVIKGTNGKPMEYTPTDWLKISMDKKVLYQIKFPKLNSQEYTYASYKITPRRVNAHAYVNVAAKFRTDKNCVVKERPSIVVGGIDEKTHHVSKTENMMENKRLNEPSVLKEIMACIAGELKPDKEEDWHADSAYRVHLVQACVYKTILKAIGADNLSADLRTAIDRELPRGISSGTQEYKTNEDMWPINKPVEKLEAKDQAAGTAEYTGDIPAQLDELFGAIVYTNVAACEIAKVDTSEALKMKGVTGYIDHTDIPANNNYLTELVWKIPEELFCSGKVAYSGQPVGLILASSTDLAREAAGKVKITYKNHAKPVLSIKEGMKHEARVIPYKNVKLGEKPKEITKTFSGEMNIGSQYHYTMETNAVLVKPIENGEIEVYTGAQFMIFINDGIRKITGIPNNKINIYIRRMGGSFGGKAKAPVAVSCMATVGVLKFGKPVRIVCDMHTNTNCFGKRLPYYATYKVGATEEGLLQSVETKVYCDPGFTPNEMTVGEGLNFFQVVYHSPWWDVDTYGVTTDTPSNTWCRSPGSTQFVALMEIMLEHVAHGLGLDPLEVKLKNQFKKGDPMIPPSAPTGPTQDNPTDDQVKMFLEEENPMPEMIKRLSESSDFKARVAAVADFNKANKWRKRGISLMPGKYPMHAIPFAPYYCKVGIHATDGTVVVIHGGIETGQGINTKVAQVVAKELGLGQDYSNISVKRADINVHPNNCGTGGSTTSEMTCVAAQKASREIRARLDAVAANLPPGTPQAMVIGAALMGGVSLTAEHGCTAMHDKIGAYNVWVAGVTEVEIDVLTGEKRVIRTDIMEDTGASISPAVDVGQVEGAFLFGLGLWTSEKIVHHPHTGKLLTDDTWNYKPPTAYDIPEVMNVTLVEGDKSKGVLSSKGTGEPATHLGLSVALAIRHAIQAAKKDLGTDSGDWINLEGPMTVEQIQRDTKVTADHFTL